jgi:hypothetical protein
MWRYQKLLAIYAKVLDADPINNPYPSLLRAFLKGLRGFLPSSMRQSRERARQMGQVPNILAVDLIGAEAVLEELETLTTAQLSAIEECHRINVRRLRQRSIFGWGGQQASFVIGGLSGLVLTAGKWVH